MKIDLDIRKEATVSQFKPTVDSRYVKDSEHDDKGPWYDYTIRYPTFILRLTDVQAQALCYSLFDALNRRLASKE